MTFFWTISLILLFIAVGIILVPFANASKSDKLLIGVLVVFMPLFVGFFYWHNGTGQLYAQSLENKKHETLVKQEIERLGSADQVIATLEKRLSQDPTSTKGWFLLGRLYLTTAQYEKASEALRTANRLEPNNTETMIQLSEALFLQHQQNLPKEAINLLSKVLEQNPTNINALNLLGLNAMQNHHYQKAITYWQRILDNIDNNSEDARVIKSMITEANKKHLMHLKIPNSQSGNL